MKCECGQDMDYFRCRNPTCPKNPDGGLPFQRRDQVDILPAHEKPWAGLQGLTGEAKEKRKKREQAWKKKREILRRQERERLDSIVSSFDPTWTPKDAERKRGRK